MKISVIIPTYKPQNYLWNCLDSMVAQTLSKDDFEVVLVLNGCDEPYKGNILEYISVNMQGVNINFIHTAQSGVSNARNIALNVANGEYITFIDDDDFVSPDYLQELYDKASPDTIALSYPYAFVDGDIEQIGNYVTKEYEKCAAIGKQLYTKVTSFFSAPCMKLIPKSYIQDRRYDNRLRNGEDTLFMFLISDKFRYVDFTSKKAIYYRRIREGSAVNNNRTTWQNVKSNLLQCLIYFQYLCKAPLSYNWIFFATRVGGALYSALTYRGRS